MGRIRRTYNADIARETDDSPTGKASHQYRGEILASEREGQIIFNVIVDDFVIQAIDYKVFVYFDCDSNRKARLGLGSEMARALMEMLPPLLERIDRKRAKANQSAGRRKAKKQEP